MESTKRSKSPPREPPMPPPNKVCKRNTSTSSECGSVSSESMEDIEKYMERIGIKEEIQTEYGYDSDSNTTIKWEAESISASSDYEIFADYSSVCLEDEKILSLIFSSLDHSSLLAASLVNSSWEKIIRKHLLAKPFALNQVTVKRKAHFGSRLELNYFWVFSKSGKIHTNFTYDCRIDNFIGPEWRFPKMLKRFGAQFSALHLHWLDNSYENFKEEWDVSLKYLSNLETLVILDDFNYYTPWSFSPNVDFTLPSVKELYIISKISPKFCGAPKLKWESDEVEFSLGYAAYVFLKLCPNIQFLHVEGPFTPFLKTIKDDPGNFSNLTKLHLQMGRSHVENVPMPAIRLVTNLPNSLALTELTLPFFVDEEDVENQKSAAKVGSFRTPAALNLRLILCKLADTLEFLHISNIRVCPLAEEDRGVVKIPVMKKLRTFLLSYKNASVVHSSKGCVITGKDKDNPRKAWNAQDLHPIVRFDFTERGDEAKIDFPRQFPSLEAMSLFEVKCTGECSKLWKKSLMDRAFSDIIPFQGPIPKFTENLTNLMSNKRGKYSPGTMYDPCDCCDGQSEFSTGKCSIV